LATTSKAVDTSTERPSAAPRRSARWLVPAALLLTAVPFVVAAVRVLLTRDSSFHFAGDQAIIGLATYEAGSGRQLLGPYSRYGWAHPGPAWFYLMAPWLRLFGGDDAALVAANLVVHGLLAVLLVAAVPRRDGDPAPALVAAGVVLLYALRMPSSFFVDVWNPFALLLGAALLLVLAVRCRAGDWAGLLALVATGGYLVQTHVGTAPLVAVVGLVGLTAFAVGRRRARSGDAAVPSGRRGHGRWAVPTLAVVLVAMWWPVVQQQVTAPPGEGNLDRLVEFFLLDPQEAVHPTVFQAVVAVGRVLAMAPYGWDPGPWEMDVSTLPPAVLVGLVAQVAASALLLLAGRRWRRADAWWSGVVTLVALLAAVASAKTISGPVYWYLLTWVSVLPAVTLIGLAGLLDRVPVLARLHQQPATARPRVPLLAGALVLVVGSAALSVSLGRALSALPASEGVLSAQRLLDDALVAEPGDEVRVDVPTHDRWPLAAGLVENLVADDLTVTVSPGSADLFGTARVSEGGDDTVVTVVAPDDPVLGELLADGARELGTVSSVQGPTTVLLSPEG
jgi:hypothetical protein